MPLKENLLRELTHLRVEPDDIGFDTAAINLVLNRHNAQHSGQPPIAVCSLGQLDSQLEKIRKNHPNNSDKQYQIIVEIRGHFTTVGLKIAKDKSIQAIVLDASNDLRLFHVLPTLLDLPNLKNVYLAQGNTNSHNLQKDNNSCPVFSLDHAFALQKTDLFTYIEQDKIDKKEFDGKLIQSVSWEDFPPSIYRNVQSSTQWKNYKEDYKKKFKVDDSFFKKTEAYRNYHYDKTRQSDKNADRHQGNIMPSVFRGMTTPAIEFMLSSKPRDLYPIIHQGTKMEATVATYLKLVKDLVDLDWSNFTRVGNKPSHLLTLRPILNDKKLNDYEKVIKIKEITKDTYSATPISFFFKHLVSGRDELTNNTYKYLSQFSLENVEDAAYTNELLSKVIDDVGSNNSLRQRI